MGRPAARIRRTGPGRYAVELTADERDVLAGLAAQLRSLIDDGTDDPRVRRLFPTAYHEDADRDLEYQLLVRDELVERRRASLEVLGGLAGVDELDAEGVGRLMRALNDVRLVLGTILDVSEEDRELDPDASDFPLRLVYLVLSDLLGEVVEALTDGLGDPDPADGASP